MILVTGAAGRLGKRVVRQLLDAGREVRATDRVPFDESPVPVVQADLCDWEQAAALVDGVEAIIHMGAIPGPLRAEPRVIFENNMVSTFNLFMAAAERGIRRVVFSSSAFAMGWAHDPDAFVPEYLPLDEEHPMTPFEPYGLSKQLGEYVARMFTRTSDMSVVSIRFTNMVPPEEQTFPWPAPTPENPTTLVMWAYADPRDVADAHVLSLDAPIEGHEAFLIAQPVTRFSEPTVDLIRRNLGSGVEIRRELRDNASVISTEKARRVLGWAPERSWMKS